ncbi:MAG: cell division protein FtsW [Rhodobacteraceae bacterium]|nr:MAG: cell division protein FtsW [Paracoccaceae bacterium]|tara:strand:+ start:95 stop:1237 length:1143 start_codon:yes stop_codon:yes gene_type:complete
MNYSRVSSAVDVEENLLYRWWLTVDKTSIFLILILMFLGLLMCMASSTELAVENGKGSFFYVGKQAIFCVVGFVILIGLSMSSIKFIRRISIILFFFSLSLLIVIPIFGTDFGKGAYRWLSLGFISFQPSELIKPFYVIFASWLFVSSIEKAGLPGISISAVVSLILIGLLVLQPDFGQASLIIATWSIIYFASGAPVLLLIIVAALAAAFGFYIFKSYNYVADRITNFMNSEIDPLSQLGRARSAIQEGGYLGVGLGEGKVKVHLPDAHTDFIIAVAAEEYGLILCFLIIGLIGFLVIRAIFLLSKEESFFIRLSGTGIAGLIGMQALINLAVTVRLIPAKGMTLPFISYGGSSLISVSILCGILLCLTKRRPRYGLNY